MLTNIRQFSLLQQKEFCFCYTTQKIFPPSTNLTLWPFQADKLKPPLYPGLDGTAVDKEKNVFTLYPEAKNILSFMSKHFKLATASRIEDICSAYQLMHFLKINHYFPLKEIYPASKTIHLRRLKARSGFDFNEMLFFDDDIRSVRAANRVGVKAYQVVDGVSWTQIIAGLKLFGNPSIVVNNKENSKE